MKKVFFVIAIASFSFASAQQNKNQPYVINVPKSRLDTFFFNKPTTLKATQPKLLNTLPNGNNVYALPQDNMPCIVPDMSQHDNMPVIKPEMRRYTIPNPVYPPQNKVEPLTPNKLKELQDHLNKK